MDSLILKHYDLYRIEDEKELNNYLIQVSKQLNTDKEGLKNILATHKLQIFEGVLFQLLLFQLIQQ